MKINAISNHNFYNTHFEGKKNKVVSTPSHTPSAVKAIPVALFMAMIPINTQVAKAQVPQVTQTVVQKPAQNERVVNCIKFPNATPKNKYDCKIYCIDTDNVGNTIEKLKLVFERDEAIALNPCEYEYNYERYTIDLKALRQEINQHQTRNGQVVRTENKYYMFGPGSKRVYTLGDNNEAILTESEDSENMKFEISEELYKFLADHTIHDNNGCSQTR